MTYKNLSTPARLGLTLALLLALGGLAPLPTARAAATYTIEVDAVKDSNPGGGCTLREAIDLANANSAPGTYLTGCTIKGTSGLPPITYQLNLPAYTYTLTGASGEDDNASGDLDIEANVIIVGQGATKTIISGGGIDRIFHIDPGSDGSFIVQIGNVTIYNGSANSSGGGIAVPGSNDSLYLSHVVVYANTSTWNSGGIYNGGTLNITSSDVYSNTSSAAAAYGGGGIFNTGSLSITGSDIYSNTLTGALIYGGGIYNRGTMAVAGGSITGNQAGNEGGGGIANEGTANLSGVTVSYNQTPDLDADDGGIGAGIYNWGAITVTDCTISYNQADGFGGGISNGSAGTVVVSSTTVYSNTAGEIGGGVANAGVLTITYSSILTNTAQSGGGIHSIGDLYLVSSRVISNSASYYGGGMRLYSGSGKTASAVINDTVVSRNTAASECGGILLYARNNSTVTLTLENSTLSHNRGTYGGGFEVWLSSSNSVASATLTNSDILSNTAVSDDGGGVEIWANSASTTTVKFDRVTIRGNVAAGDGGGVEVYAGSDSVSTLTFDDSLISGNQADYSGGGIHSYGGGITLAESTVSGNTAGGDGGGIYSDSAPEPLRLEGCTVSGNTANDDSYAGGGGVYLYYSSAVLTNTTISGNAATATHGGGIGTLSDDPQTMKLTHCTIYSNTSAVNGGGMFLESSFTVNVRGSIVAGNYAAGSGDDISGAIESQDYNLIQETAGATIEGTTTHDITGESPLLALLADNGGRTWTHALLAGSPALDAIPAASCALATDQRGVSRPQDGDLDGTAACDIGAYEFVPTHIYLPLVLRNH